MKSKFKFQITITADGRFDPHGTTNDFKIDQISMQSGADEGFYPFIYEDEDGTTFNHMGEKVELDLLTEAIAQRVATATASRGIDQKKHKLSVLKKVFEKIAKIIKSKIGPTVGDFHVPKNGIIKP